MTLDLTSLAGQVKAMTAKLKIDHEDRSSRRSALMRQLEEQSELYVELGAKVERSWDVCTWLLAKPTESLNNVYLLPPKPQAYTVAAADGSQLDVDRHEMPMCYMVNTGRAVLRYGPSPHAALESSPRLFYEEADLFIQDGIHRVPVQGSRLAARRDVEEGKALVQLVERQGEDEPLLALVDGTSPAGSMVVPSKALLALVDGTLIRWNLESAEQFVREQFLREYLASLTRLRELGVAVAGYISRPGSGELAGTMRISICPDERANCRYCSTLNPEGKGACSKFDGFVDRHIFERLVDGERSAVFCSMSKINIQMYGEHCIHFFYLAVGGEVARVEVPKWVASDKSKLDLVHAILYDQCLKGQGYPVALARAHEKAVITAVDRRCFLDMLHTMLEREGLPVELSRKSISKQVSSV